jgi:hypothetical protein
MKVSREVWSAIGTVDDQLVQIGHLCTLDSVSLHGCRSGARVWPIGAAGNVARSSSAFDKVRQAGRGMPAVMIRQLDAIARIVQYAQRPEQRAALLAQAEMICRSSEESVLERLDRDDVRRRYDRVLELAVSSDASVALSHGRIGALDGASESGSEAPVP